MKRKDNKMKCACGILIVIALLNINCASNFRNAANGIPSNYAPLKVSYYIIEQQYLNGNIESVNIVVKDNDGFHSKLPEITNKIEPVYPPIAVRAGVEGTVTVSASINTDGNIIKVIMRRSDAELFNNSVLDAVKQWKFTPLYYKGVATIGFVDIPISFVLEGRKGRVVIPE